jgi:hypothetical protein
VPDFKSVQHRSATALVATYMQMTRHAHLARMLHQARQRSLERRVRQASDMKEIVQLQRKLDAQQSQAAVVEQAAERFRNRAQGLAVFARSGLTMADFHRMGVEDVVDVPTFAAEVARVQREAAGTTPRPAPRRPPARRAPAGGKAHGTHPAHGKAHAAHESKAQAAPETKAQGHAPAKPPAKRKRPKKKPE